ncbi:MAG: exodeoxyribonuclease VII small subunit [Anaerolineae bacterium]
MKEEIASLSFEESYARLDQVIEALEAGNRSLEDSLALYEEGVRLAARCEEQLRAAELRLTELLDQARDGDA